MGECINGNRKAQNILLIKTIYAKKDYPFGPEPAAIKVGPKMFALISVKDISLKCDPFMAKSLREQYPSITPGGILNEDGWNTTYENF